MTETHKPQSTRRWSISHRRGAGHYSASLGANYVSGALLLLIIVSGRNHFTQNAASCDSIHSRAPQSLKKKSACMVCVRMCAVLSR